MFAYYEKPFFSYHLWIILRKYNIKYSSKWVYYLTKNDVGDNKYVLITYDLRTFLKFLDKNYWNNFFNLYNSINNHYSILSTLYQLDLFDYNFFNIDSLKYEDKRKLKAYKSNKELNDLIMHDKIIKRFKKCVYDDLLLSFNEFKNNILGFQETNYNVKESKLIRQNIQHLIFKDIEISDLIKRSNRKWKLKLLLELIKSLDLKSYK